MKAERASDREFVVTRFVLAPPRRVFDFWTNADLFRQWWVPASFGLTLLTCEMDVRTGGTYRLTFQHPDAPEPMAFHGRYLDVVPHSRIVWSNDEAGGAGQITTVTFEEKGGTTLIVATDLYPTKEALDEAIATDSIGWSGETFDQLDAVLGKLAGM